MYILASTFGGIIHVNIRISCIHVQCLLPRPDARWLKCNVHVEYMYAHTCTWTNAPDAIVLHYIVTAAAIVTMNLYSQGN